MRKNSNLSNFHQIVLMDPIGWFKTKYKITVISNLPDAAIPMYTLKNRIV